MNAFKRVIVKPYGKDRFELVEDFKIEDLRLKNATLDFTIQKGFKTDGASIPRLFWCFFPPFKSEYFSAALTHDFLCQNSFNFQNYKIADEALRVMMKELECNAFKTWLFYASCLSFHALKCSFLWCKERIRNVLA